MRHQKSGRRFNRDTDSRKALMRNLCTSLLESGRITTTEAKAKEPAGGALITTAKDDDLSDAGASPRGLQAGGRRASFSNLLRASQRPGGYPRIIRKGPRLGDAAPMVVIELVD
jgi:large subunit ribosomal protein L17